MNEKVYVGRTQNFSRRKAGHVHEGKLGKNHKPLYRSMFKYGVDKFEFSILEDGLTFEQSLEREKFWIAELCADDLKLGYNLTRGGEGTVGYRHSAEARQKLSALARDKPRNFDELKAGARAFYDRARGVPLSAEHVEKLRQNHVGFIGCEHSDATKKKMCEAAQRLRGKLTDEQVAQLRSEFASGSTRNELAAKYEVSYSLIKNILAGRARKDSSCE